MDPPHPGPRCRAGRPQGAGGGGQHRRGRDRGLIATGIVVLLLAALVAAGFGLYRRHVDGRFVAHADVAPTAWDHVAAVAPGSRRGERATLVQFSSAFCAPCRTARVVLSDVAAQEDGVRHLEIDAEQHLGLVRTLDVRRTPTTLILDADGHEVLRASGAPQKRQVLAAIAHSTGARG